MIRVTGTWDGKVIRIDQPIPLAPNTRVVLTIEPLDDPEESPDAAAPEGGDT